MYKVLGIDLAAKSKNPTGLFFLSKKSYSKTVYTDEEILNEIIEFSPNLIVIDSPLRIEEPYRDAEKMLIKLGFHPLPLNMKTMKELYKRAKRLIDKIDIEVIETFPRAVEKILGFKYSKFQKYFRNKHEYDAWLCSITGFLYLNGLAEKIGKEIVLPKIKT